MTHLDCEEVCRITICPAVLQQPLVTELLFQHSGFSAQLECHGQLYQNDALLVPHNDVWPTVCGGDVLRNVYGWSHRSTVMLMVGAHGRYFTRKV